MRKVLNNIIVFVVGGLTYGAVEVICRGYTFISMGAIGGLCMLVLHQLNDERRNGVSLTASIFVSTAFILSAELVSGEILNRTLKLHIWSYADRPFNFDGQICLLYAILWIGLSFVGIVFDEWLRLKILRQKNYPIFRRKVNYNRA